MNESTKSTYQDKSKQKENAVNAKPKSILEAFEYIVELAENSNLDSDFLHKASAHIKYASRKLKLTPVQTVLLAIFIDRSEDHNIKISSIAEYLGCRTIKILRLAGDVDALEAKRYVRAARSRTSVCYRVPPAVLESLRNNKPYVPVNDTVSSLDGFFERINLLINEKEDDELTYATLVAETKHLLDQIKDSHFAKSLMRCNMDDDEIVLFTYMAHMYVENDDDNIRFDDMDCIYDENRMPRWMKNLLRSHSSALFANRLIENVNEDGMARSDAFKLTEAAKEEFLDELNLSRIGRSEKDLILPDSFPEKRLVYNDSEKRQIEDLTSILGEERFRDVQTRFEKAGMRTGFCCLFYGTPGTGKTETVYQIARATKRRILRVDIDKIKSCWIGESEKNIKALFERYRNICKNSTTAPILLFNEADAVLGIRMENAARAADKMENSIQNIILQEMENLEGIMIATTNLTSNLDKAFERRFLYKIQFSRPTAETRARIWQSMMPCLKDDEALALAQQFDLSGGEIENIVRKQSVSSILSGKETADLSDIFDLCRHERLHTSHPRIGF